MSEGSKCPFTGAGTPPKFPTGRGTSNRDWWPNSLNLKILSQHSSLVNPMDKKFNYAKEFKKLNFKALKKDIPIMAMYPLQKFNSRNCMVPVPVPI